MEEGNGGWLTGKPQSEKYVPIMLAIIGLIAVSAANHAAQAETTLYTSATHAGKFDCNVVNVSEKTLNITIAIVDGTANPPAALNSPVFAQTANFTAS
jgi:hypothetical protein